MALTAQTRFTTAMTEQNKLALLNEMLAAVLQGGDATLADRVEVLESKVDALENPPVEP